MKKLKLFLLLLAPFMAFGQQVYRLPFDTVIVKKNLKLPNYGAGILQLDASGHVSTVAVTSLPYLSTSGGAITNTTSISNNSGGTPTLVLTNANSSNAPALTINGQTEFHGQAVFYNSVYTPALNIPLLSGSPSSYVIGQDGADSLLSIGRPGRTGLMVNDTAILTGNGSRFLTTHDTAGWHLGVAASWTSITGKPTTVSGFGITDAVSTGGSFSNPSWITALAYAKLTGAPTNVSSFANDAGYLPSTLTSTYTLHNNNFQFKLDSLIAGTTSANVNIKNGTVNINQTGFATAFGANIWYSLIGTDTARRWHAGSSVDTISGHIEYHKNTIRMIAATASQEVFIIQQGSVDPTSPMVGSIWNNGGFLKYKGTSAVRTIANLDGSQAFTNKDFTGTGNTFPIFNQNTTGSAFKLTTARAINGVNFDGTAAITITANTTNGLTLGYGFIPAGPFTGASAVNAIIDTSKLATRYYVTSFLNAHAATAGVGILIDTTANKISADTAGTVVSKTYLSNFAYTKNQILNTTHNWVNQQYTVSSAANTTAPGLELLTTTAATSGNQAYSPYLHLQGNGWGTTAGTSQAAEWRMYVGPVQAATPNPVLNFDSQVNGGGWTSRLTLSSGQLTGSGFIANSGNITTGTTTDAYYANNSTAATSGVPNQYSPNIHLRAEVWNTTATAANNWVDFKTQVLTTSGTTPVGKWTLSGSLTTTSTASYTDLVTVDNLGNMTLLNGLFFPKRYTVSGLPSASSNNGALAIVTDASSPTWGATVTGGSTTETVVMSNGTNWIAH